MKMTGWAPSLQQAIMVFSSRTQTFMVNLPCNPVWDFKVILAGSRRMMQTNVGEIRKMKYVLTNPDNSDEFWVLLSYRQTSPQPYQQHRNVVWPIDESNYF